MELDEGRKKNLQSFFWGGFAGLFIVFFVNELFQSLIAYLFGGENISFGFANANFHVFFTLPEELHIIYKLAISASSIFICVVFVRFGVFMMIRSELGLKRFFSIGFQIVISGYLLISVFYGAFAVLLNAPFENDWKRMVELMQLEDIWRLAFMMGCIVLITFFLHTVSYRLKIYIDARNK